MEKSAGTEELPLENERLKRELEAKNEFIAKLGHEIRFPLTALSECIELMHDAKQPASERLQCLGQMRNKISSLTALVEDILDLSKLEAGKMEMEKVQVPFPWLFSDSLAYLSRETRKKKLDLTVSVISKVPAQIETDPAKLKQVFYDVMQNALKFTERGSIRVEFEWRGGDRPALFVRVEDTGCGIPAHRQDRVFEPFFQADGSLSRKYGGSGLGLSVARSFARVIGGDIRLLRSEMGQGSLFEFEIPALNLTGHFLEGLTEADLLPQVPPVKTQKPREARV